MSAIRVLVTNQKGGVGKSTIAANLAAYLAIQNNTQVNLIDFDKQSSSSQWVTKAPDIGLKVFPANLSYEDRGSLVLAEAKRCLYKFSTDCEISISDLTWTYAIPPEFMLEFDFLLIPSATSKFEMASSEIFILKYIESYLSQIKSMGQKILAVPSRVDQNFQPEQAFLNILNIEHCSLTPPIYLVPTIDNLVYEDFLCVSSSADVAKNFSIFGEHIAKLIAEKMIVKKIDNPTHHAIKRSSNFSVLDKYRIERENEGGNNTSPLSGWIPSFLLKK